MNCQLHQALENQLLELSAQDAKQQEWPWLVIALSGGMDSMVLLEVFYQLNQHLNWPLEKVRACYIDHQLQAASADWVEFCRDQCQIRQIPFVTKRVEVDQSRDSNLESAARKARYQALHALFKNSPGYLLTAHHGKDQSETLLLNLFRGSGVNGLSAMPTVKMLQDETHILHLRPFIEIPYQTLKTFASEHQLQWIEDPTNQYPHFQRNWIRHQLLPAMTSRYPSLEGTLIATAQRMQESRRLLEKMAALQLDSVLEASQFSKENLVNCLPLPKRIAAETANEGCLSWSELKNMIHYWQNRFDLPLFSSQQFEWLISQAYVVEECSLVLQKTYLAKHSSAIYHLSKGQSWRLFDHKLFFLASESSAVDVALADLDLSKSRQNLTGRWIFLDHKSYALCEGGEHQECARFYLISRSRIKTFKGQLGGVDIGSHALKRFFQSAKIPVWQRAHWPFIVEKVTDENGAEVAWKVIGTLGIEKVSPEPLRNRSSEKAPTCVYLKAWKKISEIQINQIFTEVF